MPPVPHHTRRHPARPANLHVSPRAFWLGVAAIALLTVISFEVGYLLGKPRRDAARPGPQPEVAATTLAPETTPPPKKAAPKAPASTPSEPPPPAKPLRQDTKPAPPPKPEPTPKPAAPVPPPEFTFAAAVLPVLQAKCVSCHGGFTAKAKLDVRTIAALARGGNAGPSIVAGEPEVSPLWTWIASGNMPPKGKPPLTAAEKKLIKDWIADGAR